MPRQRQLRGAFPNKAMIAESDWCIPRGETPLIRPGLWGGLSHSNNSRHLSSTALSQKKPPKLSIIHGRTHGGGANSNLSAAYCAPIVSAVGSIVPTK